MINLGEQEIIFLHLFHLEFPEDDIIFASYDVNIKFIRDQKSFVSLENYIVNIVGQKLN